MEDILRAVGREDRGGVGFDLSGQLDARAGESGSRGRSGNSDLRRGFTRSPGAGVESGAGVDNVQDEGRIAVAERGDNLTVRDRVTAGIEELDRERRLP